MFLERDPKLTPLARDLRKNMTPWERRLWDDFLREQSPRFLRQKPIGRYIVDFYCPALRLAVELDGGQHYEEEGRISDACRTAELNRLGVRVLRFSNLDVDRNFQGVCEHILNTAVKLREESP